MRVDFYLLSRDPVEAALPAIARAALRAGERMLVVSGDSDQLATLDKALWEHQAEEFLAHGMADNRHAERQPILLSDRCEAVNGARFVALADAVWRDEAFEFERAFVFYPPSTIDEVRACWRKLGQREDVEKHFWKQNGGRWAEGP